MAMLCSVCRAIDFSASPPRSDYIRVTWNFLFRSRTVSSEIGDTFFAYRHHETISALRSASSDGCHLCALILDIFEYGPHRMYDGHPTVLPDNPVELRWYPGVEVPSGTAYRCLAAVLMAPPNPDPLRAPMFFAQYDSPLSALLSSKALNPASANTGINENLALAATWMNRCLQSHSKCAIATRPCPPLPTRVLDVAAPESPSGLRLIDGARRFGPYITLSHCWGKSRIITTTQATVAERAKSIDLGSLSQTFRDAVAVARALSIRYLWIDSLCIVQDSVPDWTYEAERMGHYYCNSFLTVAAVSSAGGDGGLFAERDGRLVCPIPADITFSPPESTARNRTLGSSQSGFISALYFPDDARQIWGDSRPPLWGRAWVLQERILSPRLLMFSKAQMSWLCQEEMGSENTPDGRERETRDVEADATWALLGWQTRRELAPQDAGSASPVSASHRGGDPRNRLYGSPDATRRLYHAWYDVVSEYSHCQLTVASDVFPALAGIVAAFANALRDHYVLGIWRNDVHRGLIWKTEDSGYVSELRHSRAPSWSWASHAGACRFPLANAPMSLLDISKLRIENVGRRGDLVPQVGDDEMWPLEVAGLVKKAHPFPWIVQENLAKFSGTRAKGDHTNLLDALSGMGVGWFIPDAPENSLLVDVWCLLVCVAKGYPDLEQAADGSVFNCMCCGKRKTAKRFIPPKPWIEGLGLVCLDEKRRIFMRVGTIRVIHLDWFRGSKSQRLSII